MSLDSATASISENACAGEPVRGFDPSVLGLLPMMIYVTDLDHNLLYLNHAGSCGSPEDYLGSNVFDLIHPDDRDEAMACRRRVLETGKPDSYYSNIAREICGGLQKAVVHPLAEADGIKGFAVVITDVAEQEETDRKRERAEQETELRHRRFRALTEQSSELISIVDADGKFIYYNPSHVRRLGYADADLERAGLLKLVHTDDRDLVFRYVRMAANAPGTDFKLPAVRLRRVDGSWITVETIVNDLRHVDGIRGFVVSGRDVTDRLRAETDVRNFKTISDRANYGAMITDLDGVILYANEAMARMHGLQVEDVPGCDQSIFHSGPQLASVGELQQMLLVDGAYTAKEIWHTAADGRKFPTLMNGTVVRDDDGGPVFVSTTAIDITELKLKESEIRKLNETLEERVEQRTEELREAQAQLVEAEKMASLGGLVAGVAHEINTPVGVGVTAASHLETQTERIADLFSTGGMKKSDLAEFIETSRKSGSLLSSSLARAARLIRDFKSVAVDTSLDGRHVLRLKDCLDNALAGLEAEFAGRFGGLEVDCDPDLYIQAGPGDLTSVIGNLVRNSVVYGFAGRKPGRIRIRARLRDGRIELLYRDDGNGMDADVLSRLFDPFFTTCPGGDSTGLGMHIVYNLIVHKLNGSITCESRPGEGVAYRIVMPRAEMEGPHPRPSGRESRPDADQ